MCVSAVFTNNLTLTNLPSIARPRWSSTSPNGAGGLLARQEISSLSSEPIAGGAGASCPADEEKLDRHYH